MLAEVYHGRRNGDREEWWKGRMAEQEAIEVQKKTNRQRPIQGDFEL